jgi:phosphopantothenoylcysteine decarboxylase/phosphopantothenate--cysteine ligase
MRILITAGATREYIDPVRFISNASSGRTGYALARAALKAGHKVTLITTVEKSKIKNQKSKLRIVTVETAGEMFEAVKKYFPRCDCLIMAAAVSDYTPAQPAKTKIKKSNKSLTIKLKPTPDILKWAGAHKKSKIENRKSKIRPRCLVVGFALEDKNLLQNAEKKLQEKNLDMIIANTPAAIGSDKATVHIKTPDGPWVKIENATKTTIAKKIIDLLTC